MAEEQNAGLLLPLVLIFDCFLLCRRRRAPVVADAVIVAVVAVVTQCLDMKCYFSYPCTFASCRFLQLSNR